MFNKISSYHRTTRNAHATYLREQGSAKVRAPMRKLVLVYGWLIGRA
ncbi:MAG TPA: hypothetical protein VLU38_03675 [Methanomassiliicoccales archaeon]|nr:hypothetical protein [Methanomassiliicoccales archaeon]